MRKSRIHALVASGCICAGAIATVPALASGASSPPPAVTSAAATNVNSAGATLNGSVNPNGQDTSYAFDWGTTTSYGHETPFTSAGAGTTANSISAAIAGLTPGTTYHFRAIAKNAAGTSNGSDESFATSTPTPSVPAPAASTGTASQLSSTALRVNGSLNPKGQATTYFFQYGTTTGYGLQTPPVNAGSGASTEAVHAVLGGLTGNTTYHYRLVAQSAGGPTYGADHSAFDGPAPSSVAFMGRMGFVSPGGIIGVEAGCFGGRKSCQGHVTMTAVHGGEVLGQRNFDIPAATGGFQNIGINAAGKRLLAQNGVWHLLEVNVKVTTTAGQNISQTMTLARWVWH
ncbi:MAG: fibronectin type III domain-containing protein [Solirubrobacteraceae bacterium]